MRLALTLFCALRRSPAIQRRIDFPLERRHNHSSSVAALTNGDLGVAWFHWLGERTADDVVIDGARWSHTTGKWSAPFVTADAPGFPEIDPALFHDRAAAADAEIDDTVLYHLASHSLKW